MEENHPSVPSTSAAVGRAALGAVTQISNPGELNTCEQAQLRPTGPTWWSHRHVINKCLLLKATEIFASDYSHNTV